MSDGERTAGLQARFFDGVHSQGVPCWLRLVPPGEAGAGVGLRVALIEPVEPTTAALRTFSAHQIEWPDAGQTRVALIRFADGSQAQIDGVAGNAALAQALRAAGYRAPTLHAWGARMAGSWRWLLAGAVTCSVLSVAAWLYALPLAATAITQAVPTTWESQLASSALNTLDQTWLKPSALPMTQREQITRDFAALVATAWPDNGAPRYALEFRAARHDLGGTGISAGANALALPGGTLVVTDELVALAEPEALLGVLAHELGHVQRRHALRRVVEGSLLGAAVAVITGDITSVLATAPVLLATLSFSRAHEREADCYALQTLRRGGRSPEPLARLLDTLAGDAKNGAADPKSRAGSVLSSHPSTPERVQLLRNPAAARTACG